MITSVIPHAGDETILWSTIKTLGREFGGAPMLLGDDSSKVAVNWLPKNMRYLEGPRRGFAANANMLAREVKTDWFLLVNNDVELHRNFGHQVRRYVKYADKNVGLVATSIWRKDGTLDSFGDTFSAWLGRPLKRGRGTQDVVRAGRLPLLSVSGAVMLVRTAAWRELNGLDEGFGQYYEDVDFGWRLIEHKWRIDALPQANSTHYEGQTYTDEERAYFGARNNLWLIRRHFPKDTELLKRAIKSWQFKARRSAAAVKEKIERGLADGQSETVLEAPAIIQRRYRIANRLPTFTQEMGLAWGAYRRRSF